MTDTPEIDRLREQSWQGDGLPRHDTVFLLDAIQAVRDTEAKYHAENVRRARAATAKDYCYRGHEFTPENTWIDPDGWRRCRECRAIRQRAWRARQKDAA